MKLTTNYSLKKPEGSDVVNIDDFNYNADIIDANLSDLDKRVYNSTGYQHSNDITLLNGTYYPSWAEPSYVVKIGKICILHCVVSNRAITVGTELFRIPSFAIPKQHHRFFGRGEVANEAKKIVSDYDVETSGVVRYYGNNNPVDELHAMYIDAVWEVE